VLSWDARRSDLPRNKDGPTLQVRANGTVAVTDPHGSGRPVEAKLSAAQRDELLRFVVGEPGALTSTWNACERPAARRRRRPPAVACVR